MKCNGTSLAITALKRIFIIFIFVNGVLHSTTTQRKYIKIRHNPLMHNVYKVVTLLEKQIM